MGVFIDKPEEWIGYEVELEMGEITELLIQRYAMAVGDYNPLYFDDDYARSYGYEGIIAPPNLIPAMVGWGAGPRLDELREDGTIVGDAGVYIIPLNPGVRTVGGGQELEFVNPVRPGYIIKVRKKVTEIREKESKRGLMCVFVIESVYTNQHDQVLVVLRDTKLAFKW